MKNKSLVIFLLFVVCFYSLNGLEVSALPASSIYDGVCTITSATDDTREIRGEDMDGDGDVDVVVGNNGVNKVYLNQGGGDCITWVECLITNDNYNTSSLVIEDMDLDGDLDVVTSNSGSPNVVYLNNGLSGGCISWTPVHITEDVNTSEGLALGDFDDDGYMDVAIANYNQRNRIYLSNYDGTNFNWVSYPITDQIFSNYLYRCWRHRW